MKPLEPSDRRIDQIYNPQPQVSRRWGGWLIGLARCSGLSRYSVLVRGDIIRGPRRLWPLPFSSAILCHLCTSLR